MQPLIESRKDKFENSLRYSVNSSVSEDSKFKLKKEDINIYDNPLKRKKKNLMTKKKKKINDRYSQSNVSLKMKFYKLR